MINTISFLFISCWVFPPENTCESGLLDVTYNCCTTFFSPRRDCYFGLPTMYIYVEIFDPRFAQSVILDFPFIRRW